MTGRSIDNDYLSHSANDQSPPEWWWRRKEKAQNVYRVALY